MLCRFILLVLVSTSFFSYANAGENSCETALTPAWIAELRSQIRSPLQQQMDQAVQTGGLFSASLNRDILNAHNTNYTHVLPEVCITNQNGSGRCSFFAGNNMHRNYLMTMKMVPEDFEPSSNHTHFFGMLEKANRWISDSIKANVEGIERKDRLDFVSKFADGNWHSFYQNIIAKYGMVPRTAMPETFGSQYTGMMNEAIRYVLTKTGSQLRGLALVWKSAERGSYTEEQKAILLSVRKETMAKVYGILVNGLGVPPERFEFTTPVEEKSTKDSGKKLVKVKKFNTKTYTPFEFRDQVVKYDPSEYVAISNIQRYPHGKYYEYEDSLIGDSDGQNDFPVRLLNLPFDRLEELIVDMIGAGLAIPMAVKVGAMLDSSKSWDGKKGTGIWHSEMFAFARVFGLPPEDFQLSKAELEESRLNHATHAMAIDGFDRPDPKKPVVKFRVENSWDKTWGDSGRGHMYRGWAELYLREIVVHRALLTDQELKVLSEPPTIVKSEDFL